MNYLTNIKYRCPKCGNDQPIWMAQANVTVFHPVIGIDGDGYPEVDEIIETDIFVIT